MSFKKQHIIGTNSYKRITSGRRNFLRDLFTYKTYVRASVCVLCVTKISFNKSRLVIAEELAIGTRTHSLVQSVGSKDHKCSDLFDRSCSGGKKKKIYI